MNNVIKNIRLAALGILLMLLSSNLIFANDGNDIEVNQSKKGLVAPNSCQYQWFLNNQQIPGEEGQEITVNEPGVYTVETIDENGSINRTEALVMVSATGAIVKLYLIGDSTVCNYAASAYPMMGWGQMIAYYFVDA